MPPDRLHAADGESWSVNDILANLRACHDILGGAMLRIVREDRPRWKGVHPRVWIHQTDYPTWDFEKAFDAFNAQRAELLEVIEPLAPAAWERTATVTGLKRDMGDGSMRYFADWMARHEHVHLKQIADTLKARAT